MSEWLRLLGRWLALDRSADLPLLFGPLLWGAWLASRGQPDWSALAALLLAVLFMRAAAWLAYASAASSPLQLPAAYRPPVAALLVAGLCFALPLGGILLILVFVFACAATGWALLRRSFLAQAVIAMVPAWLAVAGWLNQGGTAGKEGGLLMFATLSWSAAAVLTYAVAHQVRGRREGWASLVRLFGKRSAPVIGFLQAGAVVAFLLLGRQVGLGIFFSLGLGVAVLLGFYQQWLLTRREAVLAHAMNVWWALALFCGIGFHFLCACQS